jgi:hypothetical protein
MTSAAKEEILFWITLASVVSSIASLRWTIRAEKTARKSLFLAQKSYEDAKNDWKQRKWFDLYLVASEAMVELEAFQARHTEVSTHATYQKDVQHLVGTFRKAHAMAAVFPVIDVVTELF